ncbi:unnamed protein product [Closterium sp. Naga37s-1]|nr:unnamed protein product [Closterium sp. Naga37s-1]
MLLVKKNRVVPLADLTTVIACFPHLSHVHLGDNSAEMVDDAFLTHLAVACPKLVSLHIGKGITKQWNQMGGKGFSVTTAGLVRCCTQLQHLSLYRLHSYEYLPTSLPNLTHLRTLGLTHAAPLQVLEFTRLTSLTALALDIPDDADLDFATCCEELERLPDDIGDRLPRLRDLSICECKKMSELPKQFTALSCLQQLTISSCSLITLPESFGWLPALKALTLSHVQVRGLPASFHQLTSLEAFNLLRCGNSFSFPAAFGDLAALQCLYILKGPYAMLPDHIGGLINLHTLHLSSSFPQQLLPSSFTHLTSLTRLELVECGIVELPGDLGNLSSLRELIIQPFSDITEIP